MRLGSLGVVLTLAFLLSPIVAGAAALDDELRALSEPSACAAQAEQIQLAQGPSEDCLRQCQRDNFNGECVKQYRSDRGCHPVSLASDPPANLQHCQDVWQEANNVCPNRNCAMVCAGR